MTTQTTAITLSTSSYIQNPNGNTVITTGPAVISPYNATLVLDFTNEVGTLDSTGTTTGNQSSGIFLEIGNVAGAQARIGNLGGLVTGYEYGIFLSSPSVSNSAFVFNSGTIMSRAATFGSSKNPVTSGVFGGQGANVTVSNAGLIEGGEGVFLQTNDTFAQTVINDAGGVIKGTLNEGGHYYGVKIQDNNAGLQGSGIVVNAGLISGLVDVAALNANVHNQSTGTITGGLFALGTGTLELDAGGSFAGGANFVNQGTTAKATLVLGGTVGSVGQLANPGNYNGFGNVTVATGTDWTLGSATAATGFSGVPTIANFGTINVAGGLTGNTIDMEGSIAGTSTEVNFTGSNSSTPIVDYGNNDEIVFATLAGGAGTTYQDSYNTATGVLTVTEINASGVSVGSATATITGAPGTTLTSGSFVDINGPNGETIVLGSSTLANQGSIFLDYGAAATLTNTGTADTVPVTFGNSASALGVLNTLDINGTVAGTNNPYQGTISGFGLNDDIILGPSVLPSQVLGGQDSLSYAGSLLSVTEFNASGVSIGSTTIDVGTGYAANSFVALLGSNGVNIETPATVDEQALTFNATGGANFETTTDYSGGLAPGSSIVGGETVIIASGTAAVSVTAPVSNSGTIIVSGSSSGFVDAGTLSGSGTIIAEAGASVTLATASGAVDFGSASSAAPNVVDLNGSPTGFTGTIGGFGANDEIVLGTNVLAPGGAGTSYTDSYNTATGVLTVSEVNAAGATIGSTALTVANTGGSLTSGSFVDIAGPNGVTVALTSTPLGNSGSIFIDHGQQVTLNNSAGVDSIPVTFGSNGTSLALNVLDLNGTVAGTSSPYTGAITGFGLNDDIILGPSVLPSVAAGDSVTLSYAGSLLTVTELNSSGASIGSTTLDVGTGYAAGSFVALLGKNGVNIETPQTVDEHHFVFGPLGAGTNYQGDFENPNDYQGGVAPGSTIVAGETVTVQEPAQANVTTALTNNGLIVLDANNSNMLATAAISGTGTIEVGGDSTLALANTVGSTTDTIAFGPTGTNVLRLDGTGPGSFAGTITGEGGNDTIDLGGSFLPTPTSATAITLNYNSATGVLTVSDTVGGTVYTDSLNFAGPVPGNFSAAVSGGNIVISDIPCFAAGTRILTADGQKPVEELRVGDCVLTLRDGSEQPIIWVGQRTIDLSRHAWPEKAQPVVILAGAFGEGLPERDLTVSPDHALFMDGHLIEAKTLVNGATIIRDRTARYVTYHHIELARHDVVLAEGLAAETYLASGNRQNFESDAGPVALHPDFAAASRAGACAALLTEGKLLRKIRQSLLDRAKTLGFSLTDHLELSAKAGAESIEPIADATASEILFVLPLAARAVTLRSATGVPAEILADPSDRRELGVALTGLALIAGGKRVEIDLNDPSHTGLHAPEGRYRWTSGTAVIALPAYTGRAVLEVTLAGQAMRWRHGKAARFMTAM